MTAQKLTKEERRSLATQIIEAMRKAYEKEGEEGDFEDGLRYYLDSALDFELRDDYKKWVKQ